MSIRCRTHQSSFLSFAHPQRRLSQGPGKFILSEGYAVCRTVDVPIHMAGNVAIRDRLYLLQRLQRGAI